VDECKPLMDGGARDPRWAGMPSFGGGMESSAGAYTRPLFDSTKHFCGIRWLPSLDRRVITRHKLNTKWLTDLNGLG